MDDKDLHPSDDYSHRFFIWHEWIQAHGPLSTENVFDYFATSMFYDKQSNNQVLRMQTIHTGTPILNEAEELRSLLFFSFSTRSTLSRRFTGIEFALAHVSPDSPPSLFIIHKRERFSPDQGPSFSPLFPLSPSLPQSDPSPPTSSLTTASTSLPTSTPCSQTDWYIQYASPSLLLTPSCPAHFIKCPPVLSRPSPQTSSRLHAPFWFRMAHNRLISTRRVCQKARP